MTVRISIDKNWDKKIAAELQAGLLSLVTDIHRKSVILAPRDTGAMVNDSNIKKISDGYQIQYGSSKTPYARKQHYEHQTRSGYLSRAAEQTVHGNTSKYFRGIK